MHNAMARRKEFEDARLVPAGMAEFERISPPPFQQLEERGQALGVDREVRREPKQDRTGLVTQQRQPVYEQFKTVDRVFGQALPVRDELRRLPGKDEIRIGGIAPACDRLSVGVR
jgi:hypothetical protein